jgi:uncharacterized protein YjbI with pentapeptide repeats
MSWGSATMGDVAVRRRSRGPVDWDAVADVRLEGLTPAGAGDLRTDDYHDGLLFEDVAFGDVAADEASFLDSRLAGCTFGDARLRRARLSTTVLEDAGAAALDLVDSTWSDVVLRRSRIGALVAHGAALERVTFDRGRLDYVNLRRAKLNQVQFMACRVEELDLGTAELTEVRFVDCEIGKLLLGGATLADVDLRGAELTALEGVGSLAGATISETQLALLGPALAEHLGIRVG